MCSISGNKPNKPNKHVRALHFAPKVTPAPILTRLVSKCFDADVVNLGVSGSGIVAAGATVTDSEGNKHTGAPASAVYAHQICFNWGEDVPAVEDVDGEDGEDVAGEDVVVVGEEFANGLF